VEKSIRVDEIEDNFILMIGCVSTLDNAQLVWRPTINRW